MIFDALAAGFAAALTGLLAWRWRKSWAAWSRAERVAAVLVVPGLLLAALILTKTPLRMLNDDWNAARLAPSVAMSYGYGLYGRADQGPILNTIYGPLTALVYVPASAASTPAGAVIVGGLLTLLLFVGALGAAFLALGASMPQSSVLRLLGFLTAFAALSARSGTSFWFENVHADAPALAFGLAACAFLLPRGEAGPGRAGLAAAALCSVLALFAKQTAVVLPPALALYVAFSGGRRPLAFFVAVAAATSAVLGGLAVLAFGADAMWFNTVTIPGRHPWEGGLADGLLMLVDESGFALAAFFLGGVYWLLLQKGDPRPWKARLSREPWLPFLFAAVFLIPTSLLGRLKVGGHENSNHALLYLTVAAAFLHLKLFPALPGHLSRGFRILATLGVLLVFGAAGSRELRRSGETPRDILRNNPQQAAFEFVRRHPRQVWLAANPLVTLYADGRLYHFDYGVFDRKLAGFPPSDRHLREHLPEDLVYASRGQRSELAGSLLRDFTREVPSPIGVPLFVRAAP